MLKPDLLQIDQGPPVVDTVAEDYKIRPQQCIMAWRSRVREFEAVSAVVHAYVPDKGLV